MRSVPRIATILVAAVTGYYQSQRGSLASILLLLGGWLAMMFYVREERAMAVSAASKH